MVIIQTTMVYVLSKRYKASPGGTNVFERASRAANRGLSTEGHSIAQFRGGIARLERRVIDELVFRPLPPIAGFLLIILVIVQESGIGSLDDGVGIRRRCCRRGRRVRA